MNKYNISLNRFCEIIDADKKHRVLRVRMPKFIYIDAYDNLMKEFSEMFGGNETFHALENTRLQIKIFNEAWNMIPVIIDTLELGHLTEEQYKYLKNDHGIENYDVYQIREYLINEHRRLVDKLVEITPKKVESTTQEQKKSTFAGIIAWVEESLGSLTIDREMSLYMFYAQYKRADEKRIALENLNNKDHG